MMIRLRLSHAGALILFILPSTLADTDPVLVSFTHRASDFHV